MNIIVLFWIVQGLALNAGGGAVPMHGKFKVIGSTFVRAGETASLTCTNDVYDRSYTYEWEKQCKVIPGQTGMDLHLHNTTRADVGYYQCGLAGSVVNGEGRHLHVFVKGDPLPIAYVDHKSLPVLGRNFSLDCNFMENYIPNNDTVYTWYKDFTEVKGQSGQTLNFIEVAETDTGVYTCTAREGHMDTTSPLSTEFHLTPNVSPNVTINRLPLNAPVKGTLGGTITLNCEVTQAFPPVPVDGYSWSYPPSSNAHRQYRGGNGSTLTLSPLTTDDSGQYFCEARTDRIFKDLILIGQASVTVDVVYLDPISLTRNLETSEGDHVNLTCHVNSHPTARITWTVNGQEVRRVTDNLDHYVIRSVACSDSDTYTCRASNTDMPGLERHATVQLHGICKQATTEPHTMEPHTENEDLRRELATLDRDTMFWRTIAIIFIVLLVFFVVAVLVLCRRRPPDANRRGRLGRVVRCLFPALYERSHNSTDIMMNDYLVRTLPLENNHP